MGIATENFHTIEIAYGERNHVITEFGLEGHSQIRTWDELWHKENALNLKIQRLSITRPDWQYVAWIDADVAFTREDILSETWHQLQHFMFVQMWETAVDLGPNQEAIATHFSFLSQYWKGKPYCYGGKNFAYYEHWHPGYAWAARREAIDHTGGLLDTAILGAGDNHMAHCLINKLDQSAHKDLHPNYLKHLHMWQTRCERYIRRNVGFVPGNLVHYWHGRKKDRRYHDRWKILVEHQFDPDWDLKRDSHGLWQLVDHGDERSIKLRDDIMKYFRARNEDSIDLE